MKLTKLQYKILGETLLLTPCIILLILGIGEISGGDISGIQHFFQLIPLILIAIVCWYYPKNGGLLLLGIATILALAYPFLFNSFPIQAILINDFLLFGIPIIAGILFFFSNQADQKKNST